MRHKLFITFILFLMAFSLTAEEPVKKVLNQRDIDHFIKTIIPIATDFDKLGVEYDDERSEDIFPEELRTNKEFLKILKKHGWDESFFEKVGVIFLGHAIIVSGEESKKMEGPQAKAIKEIESNPHLSDATKKQMIEQFKKVQGAVADQQGHMKKSAHPADLELIRSNIEVIKKVFKALSEK